MGRGGSCSPNARPGVTPQSPELEGFPRAGCDLSPQSPPWDMSAGPEELEGVFHVSGPKVLLFPPSPFIPSLSAPPNEKLGSKLRPRLLALCCLPPGHSLPSFPQHLAYLFRQATSHYLCLQSPATVLECPWWSLEVLREGECACWSPAFLRPSVAEWLPKIQASELTCWAAG